MHQAFHIVFLVLFLGSLGAFFLKVVTPLLFPDSQGPPLPPLSYLAVGAALAGAALAADWIIHSL